jgi:hypothetical protein
MSRALEPRPDASLLARRDGDHHDYVPDGCRGGVVVSRRQIHRSPELLGVREMQFGASASPRRLTVRLYGQAMRELRGLARLRATVSCQVFQPDGTDGTVKRTVELLYPRARRRR